MHAVRLVTGLCLVAVETHRHLWWLTLSSVTAGRAFRVWFGRAPSASAASGDEKSRCRVHTSGLWKSHLPHTDPVGVSLSLLKGPQWAVLCCRLGRGRGCREESSVDPVRSLPQQASVSRREHISLSLWSDVVPNGRTYPPTGTHICVFDLSNKDNCNIAVDIPMSRTSSLLFSVAQGQRERGLTGQAHCLFPLS